MSDPNQQMSEETRELLGDLTPADIRTIRKALPVFRAILGFGTVMKWLAIGAVGMLAGIVLLGESVAKIVGWFWPPPPIH